MTDSTSINKEKTLMNGINELAQSAEPTHDLWPGIESQLVARETKGYTPRWIPVAFAATLLLSFVSVFASWNNLQSAQQAIADSEVAIDTNAQNDIQSQLKLMSQEYGLAKAALLAQIGMNSEYTNSNMMTDVQANLMIIEQATNELKAAIIIQPENPNLPKLLKLTYQQELAVLTQLAKLDFGA